MISVQMIGLTLDTIGTLILAILVIAVHGKVLKEGKIDKKVIKEIGVEMRFGWFAIVLIGIGYLLQIFG
tara:strand:+ start:862 stop:1068 length:207 start_codon:yes stop_codon:yes gene_type:complete